MSFKNILGHDYLVESFQGILRKGLLAHAYIFAGIDGVGKSLFAGELAKVLGCAGAGVDSCDVCANCRRIDAGTSLNMFWITLDAGKKFVGIDKVKAIQESVALTPVEVGYKIFIVPDGDRLTEEAVNCLLKTLEEPPPATLLILLARTLDSLPETMVSRCQVVRFRPLSREIIRSILERRYHEDTHLLNWLALAADGSAGDAITFMEEGFHEKNEWLVENLSNMTIKDNFRLSHQIHGWIPESRKSSEEKRWYLKVILDFMLRYYRDILASMTTGSSGIVCYFNDERRGLIEDSGGRYTFDDIISVIDQVFIALDNLELNANTNFIFENLFTRIAVVTGR